VSCPNALIGHPESKDVDGSGSNLFNFEPLNVESFNLILGFQAED
tara:strand:+ start:532 stop:666 length:135 start_codon:yes stop_codon:yes gene_type:complete